MPARPNLTTRLRAYSPLGDAGQVIPDQGITITSAPDGPTLEATISTVTYRTLPHDLEIAVEVFDDVAGAWVEGRDSRFVILTQDGDERDVTKTTKLNGVGLMQWLTKRAALAGVTPLQANGNVEAAASTTTGSVSGHTFTWGAHILGEGDRVRITDSGKAKGLSKGSVYFVRNPGTSTFQVSQTKTGAIKSFGSSHKVGLSRVRTRITFSGSQPFSKNEAISVWDAATNQNLTNGSQYYVANPTKTTIQVVAKPGGIPIELTADALIVYRYLDGARVFSSRTPGQILGDSFLEARSRGWGQDAAGTDQVFHSWTNAGDSNSLAWPARVDDPTVTGVAVSFQPGTSLWDQTSFMLDNGWAEFASHGRTLDLFAPLTGADLSATHRIGSAATSVPKSVDLSNYATTEIVRGDGPVEVSAKVARSPWGVLEVYATAAGIGSSSAAKSYGNNDLAQHQSASVGWTVTEEAAAAAWLPVLDYQRGDWVSAYVEGSWQKLRVVQWAIAKSTDGTITVTAVLQSKKRHVLKKLAHASSRANGGRAALTTTTTPHESDRRKSAVPANLTVSSRSKASADGSASGTLSAAWEAVTQDEDGNDLTGASYEVTVRTDGQQTGHVVTTTSDLQADLPALPAGETVSISVRAISSTGTPGEASEEVEYLVENPPVIPDPPTAPTVTSTLGSITIAWDGNLVDAIDGPHLPSTDDALSYVSVQRSTDQQTWTTEAQTFAAAGSVVDLGLSVGVTYYYQLVAVSTLGIESPASPSNSASVIGIDVAQINADFQKSMSDVEATATNAQDIANQSAATAGSALTQAQQASSDVQAATTAAQQAQQAAQTAQASADGKNAITYSTAAASSSKPGTSAGDQWFRIDASGHITAQWTWTVTNGTGAWTSTVLTGSVVTNLDAGAITTGTLSSARIAAGSITTTQLAVTDLSNLYPDPKFSGPYGAGYKPTGISPPAGQAWAINDRDNIGSAVVSVKAGDAFYVEVDVAVGAGTAALTAGLWVANAAGGTDATFSAFSTLSNVQGSGTVVDYGNGWTRRWWRFTIPTTWVAVDHGSPYFQINQTAGGSGGTTYFLGNLVMRRLGGGNLVVDGSITASKIAATAIDGKTITGATIQTSGTPTQGGVILNANGITGYNSGGGATFVVDNSGRVTATNATITGTINASSGTISGTLTVNGGGITAGATTLDGNGLTYHGSVGVQVGSISDSDGQFFGTALSLAGNPTYSVLGMNTSGTTRIRSGSMLQLLSDWQGTGTNSSMADLQLDNDGSPRIWSNAIRNRNSGGYTSVNSKPGTSDQAFVVITTAGTLGTLNGTPYFPSVYSDVISTRAVYVGSNGHLGTTSSSRRTKNLHRHLKMDDSVLEKWLELPTWEFEYKPEYQAGAGIQHGLVAEEVEAAGFTTLVYYDEREGETQGQVDGFAYERMGVYNHMALKRLYRRLQDAEQQLAALTGKASR